MDSNSSEKKGALFRGDFFLKESIYGVTGRRKFHCPGQNTWKYEVEDSRLKPIEEGKIWYYEI